MEVRNYARYRGRASAGIRRSRPIWTDSTTSCFTSAYISVRWIGRRLWSVPLPGVSTTSAYFRKVTKPQRSHLWSHPSSFTYVHHAFKSMQPRRSRTLTVFSELLSQLPKIGRSAVPPRTFRGFHIAVATTPCLSVKTTGLLSLRFRATSSCHCLRQTGGDFLEAGIRLKAQ